MLSSGSTNIHEYDEPKSRVNILIVLSDENDLDVFKEYSCEFILKQECIPVGQTLFPTVFSCDFRF